MAQGAIRSPKTTGWLRRAGQAWAPAAAALALSILIYHAVALSGVSVLNLPGALRDWLAAVNLADLGTLTAATSLLAANIGAEFLAGVSLLALAVFAMMAQAMAHNPAAHWQPRRQSHAR